MAITIRNGSKGNWVYILQTVIGVEADGKFGNITEKALRQYQNLHKLTVDGVAGTNTWKCISKNAPTLRVGDVSKYALVLEYLLNDMVRDHTYSAAESAVVKAYQAANDLVMDGIVGQKTWGRLFGVNEEIVPEKRDSVKPVDYKQYDSKWGSVVYTKNNTYNRKQTIKSSGCGITSMADIIATWWDKTITPVQTAADAVAKGYRTTESGTAWGYFKYAAQKYGASKFVQTASLTTAQSCLADGGYVVVSFKKSKWTNGGHYCVLWKDDGKYIYVNDPASASSSRAKGTYDEVKAAAKQYFCFWK